MLPDACIARLLYPLSRLLADSTDKETRAQACEALTQLAAVAPALQKAVSLIANTNAYVSNRMEEPDHEKRLAAFAEIEAQSPSFVRSPRSLEYPKGVLLQTDTQLVPLICNAFYFLPNPELSTRQIASGVLRNLLNATAERMRADKAKGIEKSKYANSALRNFVVHLAFSGMRTLYLGSFYRASRRSSPASNQTLARFVPQICLLFVCSFFL